MNTIRRFFATLTLTLVLAGLVHAGDIDAPPAAPTPPPRTSATVVIDEPAEGTYLDVTYEVVLSILSIF